MKPVTIREIKQIYLDNNAYVPQDIQDLINQKLEKAAENGDSRMYLPVKLDRFDSTEDHSVSKYVRDIILLYRQRGFKIDAFSRTLEFYGWADFHKGLHAE